MRALGFVLVGLAVLTFITMFGFFIGAVWTGDGRWGIMGAILFVPTILMAGVGGFLVDE